MPYILKVSPHLDHAELVRRFKLCEDAGERMRWQAVMLKAEGRTARDIADVCKRREDWVRRTVRAYNEDGPEGLVDGRQENGPDHSLDEGQRAALAAALGADPPDGGLWTARKVTQWIKDHTGAVLTEHTGWLYMVRAGFTRQVPRPKHPDADEEAQQAFKKRGLASRVRDVVRRFRHAQVQVWAEDEGRFGLIPTYRRVWAPRGKRPTASSRRAYQWAYLFSFVQPSTGETVNFVGSTVSADVMSVVLEEFAKEAGLGADRRAVVVLDGAGWHTAQGLRIPEGVHLVRLPPYSPELQPAERVWPIVNEAVANRTFATLPELMEVIDRRCAYLDENRDYVRQVTHFHWWPDEWRCGV